MLIVVAIPAKAISCRPENAVDDSPLIAALPHLRILTSRKRDILAQVVQREAILVFALVSMHLACQVHFSSDQSLKNVGK